MEFRVLSIDAWADEVSCPECGGSNIMDTTKGDKLKCTSCLVELSEDEFHTSWTWNNWFNVGTYHVSEYGPLTEETALKYFKASISADSPDSWQNFEIEDDQYNLVLVSKDTGKPYYAIEYGAAE